MALPLLLALELVDKNMVSDFKEADEMVVVAVGVDVDSTMEVAFNTSIIITISSIPYFFRIQLFINLSSVPSTYQPNSYYILAYLYH